MMPQTSVLEVLVSFLATTHAQPSATLAALLSEDTRTPTAVKRAWVKASLATGCCATREQAEAAFAAAHIGNLAAWRKAFAS